ncbi:zinc finger protein [Macleaya cordata]|uniref:RING-type E3 ubiquitin transferase n=1 Tax=Macleaya cordata TaxID=56857 RepID=A0A200QI39_MACCD|nr:zinc finger protein [Macleaya cordata]
MSVMEVSTVVAVPHRIEPKFGVESGVYLLFFRLQDINHIQHIAYIVMGHRHVFNTSEMFESGNDQNQNQNPIHVQQPFVHLGRASAWENGSVISPMPNMSTGGVNSVSHWNSAPRSNHYSTSAISMQIPHYETATSGPFVDPFIHPSAATNFYPVPQHYADQPSSSSSYSHIINGVESGIVDPMTGSGRGPCKRKSPAIPDVCERGNTSRYYNAGSYSNHSVSSDIQPEKPTLRSQHWPWDPMGITPSYRGSNLSIAEGSERNVRSRSSVNLEVNLATTHLSNNPSLHLHSAGNLIDHSVRADTANINFSAPTREWNHIPAPLAAQGRVLASGVTGLNQGANQFPLESSNYGMVEFSGHHHNIPSRYPVLPPQNIHGSAPQVVRGGSSSYAQRAVPAYRVMSSHPHFGYVATSSGDSLQSAAHSSRHPRTLPTMGFHGGDRSGRSRSSYDRLHPLSHHDRRVAEGIMTVDQAVLYGSRNLLDQHRDMRLDIDNMSYEELLALGERIGSVNTGLSEDLISKCLIKTVNCRSDQIQEELTCVICLEEYKKEEVGRLINCGHDYHVGCIKKWLSMKNACPICKAPVLADKLKEE